jgi:hypothetical protein
MEEIKKKLEDCKDTISNVRKSMPECANKAFLKGALNNLDEILKLISDNYVKKPERDMTKRMCEECENYLLPHEEDTCEDCRCSL